MRRFLLRETQPPGRPEADSSPNLFGQIGDLNTQRYLPRQVRQAILRLLAAEPGIAVRVGVRDRGGRAGVAVTGIYRQPFPPEGRATTLVFDPTSGRLLASHSRAVDQP